MIYVYSDESMDEKKERVCTVAAIVGSKEQWESLESKWIARTKGIPFHANNCESDRGDYVNTSHSENQALYRDLAILLAESGLHGFASSVDLVAQRKAFPNADPKDMANKTYFQAFLDVIEKITAFAETANEIAEFTFDNRMESEHNAALLYANIRELNPGWQSLIASKLIFESSRANPRIQAADLFAREAMKGLDNDKSQNKRPVRKSWKALAETKRFVAYGYSTEWFSEMAADISNAATRLDFDPEGYRKWLGKRQDNLTAFIEYTRKRFLDITKKGS